LIAETICVCFSAGGAAVAEVAAFPVVLLSEAGDLVSAVILWPTFVGMDSINGARITVLGTAVLIVPPRAGSKDTVPPHAQGKPDAKMTGEMKADSKCRSARQFIDPIDIVGSSFFGVDLH
jgi:hypothetical protein